MSKKHVFQVTSIAIIVLFVYSFFLTPSEFYQSIKNKALDFFYIFQNNILDNHKYTNDIAIIAIDDETINTTEMRWPWERNAFAEILNKINSFKPKAIYLNFTFTGESNNINNDLMLSTAIKDAGNIILPSYYDSNMELITPLSAFSSHAHKIGFINKVNDSDSIVRRFRPYYRDTVNGTNNYAIELCILSFMNEVPEDKIAWKIPLERDKTAFINYLSYPKDFASYSVVNIFANKNNPPQLKDKIILIGSTSEITHDTYNTPLGKIPGVYIIANTLAALAREKYLSSVPYYLLIALSAVFSLAATMVTFKYGIGKGLLSVILGSTLILAASLILFLQGIIIDWFSVILIMIIACISAAFARYITILKIQVKELEKANIEIKNAQKEIIRSEQLSAIGKLTSIIIHEINTPLSTLTDLIEQMQYKKRDIDGMQGILNMAHQEILRAKKIGEDLRISYTPHAEEKINTNINKLIQDTASMLSSEISAKGIIIDINLDDKLPIIPVSADKIKQVFLNIIMNAVDAVEKGRHIYIRTKYLKDIPSAKYIDVIFKDEGCGISKETVNKIFDAFYTTKRHKKGSGLGLFISYEIIKAHKGKIFVESESGKGTTFTVRLPVKE